MKDLYNLYSQNTELFRPSNFDYLLPEPYRKQVRISRELKNEILSLETSLDNKFGHPTKKKEETPPFWKMVKYSVLTGGILVLSVPLLAVGKYSVGIVEWIIKQRLPAPLSSEDSISLFGKTLYRGVEARTGEPSPENPNTIHHGSPLEASLLFSMEMKSRKNISRVRSLYGEQVASRVETLYNKLAEAKEILFLSSDYEKASRIFREIKKQYANLEKQLPNGSLAWRSLRWSSFGFMVNKMASDMSGEQGWNEVNDLGHELGDGVGPLKGGPFDWGYYNLCDFAVNNLKLERWRLLGWAIAFRIRDAIATVYSGIKAGIRKLFKVFPFV
jgi:hypothetical protein